MKAKRKKSRSEIMRSVGQKNTAPEMKVRRYLHQRGFRYRLHERALPGRPDIVFASRQKVIFVHGCFWHRHEGCRKTTMPKTNREFWSAKFETNVERDAANLETLRELGWDSLVVWECETANLEVTGPKIESFLTSTS